MSFLFKEHMLPFVSVCPKEEYNSWIDQTYLKEQAWTTLVKFSTKYTYAPFIFTQKVNGCNHSFISVYLIPIPFKNLI